MTLNGHLTPLGDRVVVKPSQRDEVTKSGIVLPDTAKEKPQRGEVVAVGKGRYDDDGDRILLATTSCSPSTQERNSSSKTTNFSFFLRRISSRSSRISYTPQASSLVSLSVDI